MLNPEIEELFRQSMVEIGGVGCGRYVDFLEDEILVVHGDLICITSCPYGERYYGLLQDQVERQCLVCAGIVVVYP